MVVRFPEPESAYLVMASLRRQLQAAAIAGMDVVASDDGPVLECREEHWTHELLQELVAQYEGTLVEEARDADGALPA